MFFKNKKSAVITAGEEEALLNNHLRLSNEDLMLSFKEGDDKAFGILMNRFQKEIYNFLYRSLPGGESHDEAFQEVFTRVIKSKDSYQPQAKFSTWLYTIARNYCIDVLRKKKIRQITSLDEKRDEDDSLSLNDQLADQSQSQDQLVSHKNLAQKLEYALSQINADQREVFLLREKGDYSFDEIAQIVGSSTNTVKSRMRYALTALYDELKKLGITEL